MQKAGQLLKIKYPRISVLHGCEHVMSLFFSDLAKVSVVKELIVVYHRIYAAFGSGSTNASYAIFHEQCKSFNKGCKIGLI